MSAKIIVGDFRDERNSELMSKLEEVIYDYARESRMTYTSVIGVLQMLIMDLHNESKDD